MSLVWGVWLFTAILTVAPIMVILSGHLQEELQHYKIWQRQCSLKGEGRVLIVAGAVTVFCVSSLLLYHKLGAAQLLTDYYSPDKVAYREQLKIMQRLVAKLNKQELKLKITLQVKPDNPSAWRELAVIHSVKQDNLAAECAMQQAVNSAVNHVDGDLLQNYVACLLKK